MTTASTNAFAADAVLLGELAVAAGLAGESMTLCFDEVPAPILCKMWKHLACCVNQNRTIHVRTQADVRNVAKSVGDVRLVFVYAARLHNAVAWTAQMSGASTWPKPLILCQSLPDDLGESPGPSLVLRGNDIESEAALGCMLHQQFASGDWPTGDSAIEVEVPAWLHTLTEPIADGDSQNLLRLRDRLVLLALLRGARLRRQLENTGNTLGQSLVVEPCDYQTVRRLLRSRLIGSADEPADPLAHDMVNRANVYIELKFSPELWLENPVFRIDGDPLGQLRGRRTRQELITRREIAELGNVRSQLVRQIVESLKRMRRGEEIFRRMGLVGRPPGEREWSRRDASVLAGMLRRWSYKQVRTHFEVLRHRDMITAEREQANGPWRYLLPEELSTWTSAFRLLPPVEELPVQDRQASQPALR